MKLPSEEDLKKNHGLIVKVDFNLQDLHGKAVTLEENSLFIRPHFYQLYSKLPFGKKTGRLITGTPGIGKSIELIPILIKRVQEGKPVCYFNLHENKVIFFSSKHKTCIVYPNYIKSSHPFEKDPEFTLLMDEGSKVGLRPRPDCVGLEIIVSSPNIQQFSEWLKSSAETLTLPCPDWNEIESFCKGLNIDLEESKKRFDELGGSFRNMTISKRAYEEDLKQILKILTNQKEVQNIITVLNNRNVSGSSDEKIQRFRHRVINFEVNENFEVTKIKMATLKMEKMIENFNFVPLYFLIHPAFGSRLDGASFEDLFLRGFPALDFFLEKSPGDLKYSKIQIPKNIHFSIISTKSKNSVEEKTSGFIPILPKEPKESTFFIPSQSNYPLFDALLWNDEKKEWFFFQVTINKEKRLNGELLDKFLEKNPKLKQKSLKIHFIVPCDLAQQVKTKQELLFGYETKSNFKIEQKVVPFPFRGGHKLFDGNQENQEDFNRIYQNLLNISK